MTRLNGSRARLYRVISSKIVRATPAGHCGTACGFHDRFESPSRFGSCLECSHELGRRSESTDQFLQETVTITLRSLLVSS
jgi:hypothetical protein